MRLLFRITKFPPRIFSEIDEPLDFNQNMSTNTVLNEVSYNDVRIIILFLFF